MLLALDVRYLDVDINDHTYSKYVLFKGKAERAHYKLSDTELDAQELISNESYIYMSYKSAINIHATEIVNARHLSNCELNISGNPKYKRISESE